MNPVMSSKKLGMVLGLGGLAVVLTVLNGIFTPVLGIVLLALGVEMYRFDTRPITRVLAVICVVAGVIALALSVLLLWYSSPVLAS
ncbi:hypothetical protein [Halomarina pelagica]|uniref:hypothetical protein n=1 Tax=Halomarina pelagica TaxID=2961599 RepID=UPI0020C52707|nr:hypothetical protein [Halomarina sp. BND7]